MKKIVFVLILSGILSLFDFTNAQEISPCSTDEMNELLIQQDPGIIKITEELEEFTRNYIKNKNPKSTYVIPVVFHIMHNHIREVFLK